MLRMDSKENFGKLQSKSKRYPGKANGISFWGFLLSIFIYISIFYVFNLSPSALFNTTKFWFFISNTLILIIAADFGAFSSSTKNDYYEEYMKNTQMRSPSSLSPSSFELKYKNTVEAAKAMEQNSTSDHQKPQEKIKDVIIAQSNESQEKKLEIIELKNLMEENHQEKKQEIMITPKVDNDHIQAIEEKMMKKSEGKCTRSKSDKAIMVELQDDDDEKRIQRSQSERFDEHEKHKKKMEENDFSTMSDEELNRRVEEFIQNFNRQIRLQAARNRQNFHAHEV